MKHGERVSCKCARSREIERSVGSRSVSTAIRGVNCRALALVWASCVLADAVSFVAQAQAEAPTVAHVREASNKRDSNNERRARSLKRATTCLHPITTTRSSCLAIVQIAQRNTAEARKCLELLFERDAEHTRHVIDPGPTVHGPFARARRSPHEVVSVALRGTPPRDAYDRAWLDAENLGGALDVDTLHVVPRAARNAVFTELVQYPSVDDRATTRLPAAPLGAKRFQWYVEARARSGVLCGPRQRFRWA